MSQGDDGDRRAEEKLLGELRRLAAEVDPVPDEVLGYARAALGWRRVDAELAELLTDSELAAPPGTRGGAVRTVTFRTADLELDVEVHARDPGVRLVGRLAPAASAQIEVQRDDGSVGPAGDTDEHGRFRLELPAGGRIRLAIRRQAPEPPVETSWFDT
jgi:hypothetical protein